jgi:hypothetical protein
MDESFQLRAKRLLGPRQPAPLDFDVLRATLTAQQAETPAARAQGRFDRGRIVEDVPALLTETLLAGPDWQAAATAQRGCFNRTDVKRRRQAP